MLAGNMRVRRNLSIIRPYIFLRLSANMDTLVSNLSSAQTSNTGSHHNCCSGPNNGIVQWTGRHGITHRGLACLYAWGARLWARQNNWAIRVQWSGSSNLRFRQIGLQNGSAEPDHYDLRDSQKAAHPHARALTVTSRSGYQMCWVRGYLEGKS